MVSTHFCQKTKQSDPKVGSHHHNDVVMKLSWTWRLMFRFSAVLVTICATSNLGDCAWKSLNLTCFAKWRFLKVKSDFFLPTKVLKHKVSCFGPCDSLCTKTCFQKQFETTKNPSQAKKALPWALYRRRIFLPKKIFGVCNRWPCGLGRKKQHMLFLVGAGRKFQEM